MKFSLFNCKFIITPPFAVTITAMLMLDSTGILPYILLAVFIHETGHALCTVICGGKVKEIRFLAFGIEMKTACTSGRTSYIFITLAGIAANIFISVVLYSLYIVRGNQLLTAVSAANAAVGIFNALPVKGLDGGDILYVILSFLNNKREIVCNVISLIFIVLIAVAGIFTAQKNSNPTLLLFCIYSVICSC